MPGRWHCQEAWHRPGAGLPWARGHAGTEALPGDLVEDAAGAPQVHLVAVEAVREEALGGPVPAGGDVFRVRLLRIDAPAGPEVA